jgi:hypothetical protein
MASFLLQSSFKLGEISPLLYAHISDNLESPLYAKAARRLRNCLVIPQGGATRRFGTLFAADLTSLQSNYLLYKPFFFVHADGSKYILLFTPLAITIYRNNAVVATVVTTYSSSDIPLLSIAQSNDLVFIACRGHIPAILSRTTPHTVWNLQTSDPFVHQPTYDFLQNYDAASFTVYLPSTTTIITTANNLIGQAVTVHSFTAGIFTTNHVQGLWFGGGATIRLTAFIDSQNMSGSIVQAFNDKCVIIDSSASNRTLPGTQTVITEVLFSTLRGWPEKVAFFQNRIWFGKTASVPGLVCGSNYNGFTNKRLNFDDSRTLDTSAVSTVLYGQRATIINHMVSYKSLLVFTSSGVFSTSLDLFDPVTPLNINFINLQSGDISNDLLPDILENNVIFYDKGGYRVKTLLLNDEGRNYQAATLNILAPHLVNNPYSSAVLSASGDIDGSYLFVINDSGDMKGKMAIYNLIAEQGITAWTLQETGLNPLTEGFRHVISDDEDVYFIVSRIVNGSPKLYLEQLTFEYLNDCCIPFTQSSSTTITGLSALQGLAVDIIAGTSPSTQGYEGTYTVSGGQVTIPHAVTSGYAGLRVTPLIGTLPLLVPTQVGNNIFRPKHIKNMYVDFFESLNITVDNTKLRYFNLNEEQHMDVELVPQTNFDEVTPMSGWNPRVEIVISQDAPQPFTIIGIGMTVEA